MKRKLINKNKYIKKPKYDKKIIIKDIFENMISKKYDIAKKLVLDYNIRIEELYPTKKYKKHFIEVFNKEEYNSYIRKVSINEMKNYRENIILLLSFVFSVSLMIFPVLIKSPLPIFFCIPLSMPVAFAIYLSLISYKKYRKTKFSYLEHKLNN